MDASEAPVARAAHGHQDDSAVAASSIRGGQGTEPNGGGGPMTANTSQTQEAGDRNQEAQSEDGVDRSRGSQPHAVGLNDSQSHDNWLDDLAESYTSVGSTAAIMNQRYRVHLQKRHQRQTVIKCPNILRTDLCLHFSKKNVHIMSVKKY